MIGLDVDGVLCNFFKALCSKYNKPYYCREWDLKWIRDIFHEIESDEDFWFNLPVYTPPWMIDFEVDCYISSLPEKMKSVREDWLKKNGFPNAPLFVAHSYEKIDIIKQRKLTLFIDDRPSTCEQIHREGEKVIQFIPDYFDVDLPTDYPYIETLMDVKKYF